MEVLKWQKRKQRKKRQRRNQRRKNKHSIISNYHKAISVSTLMAFLFSIASCILISNVLTVVLRLINYLYQSQKVSAPKSAPPYNRKKIPLLYPRAFLRKQERGRLSVSPQSLGLLTEDALRRSPSDCFRESHTFFVISITPLKCVLFVALQTEKLSF